MPPTAYIVSHSVQNEKKCYILDYYKIKSYIRLKY